MGSKPRFNAARPGVWQALFVHGQALMVVVRSNPNALRAEARWLVRHRDAFLAQLDERRAVLASQFEAIDALRPMPEYDDCVAQARSFLSALPG